MSGCGARDWADQNMPVVGYRCLNWQCFTAAGRAASEAKRKKLEQEHKLNAQQPANTPANAGLQADPLPAPAQSGMRQEQELFPSHASSSFQK